MAVVRRFNRTVTRRIGALDDRYLSRNRPLGQCRVLWEIGPDGAEVRTLRARLGLDSGQLSRTLRALEADGLVRVHRSTTDGRVRVASLTARGRRERQLLDRRSDDLARSILDGLPHERRLELVEAMARVERLLTAGLVVVEVIDPAHEHARHCLAEYFAELDRRFSAGFDPARSLPADVDDMRPPAGVFLVATLRGEPVGCGALKFHGDEPAELKRMWVAPEARGLGVGRRLLVALEDHARRAGVRTLHLETNAALTEAIAMYRANGYVEVEPFNDEPYADRWFEKHLTPPGRPGSPPGDA